MKSKIIIASIFVSLLALNAFAGKETPNIETPGIDQGIIDVDSTEAFLCRADGDGGDVAICDTVNGLWKVDAIGEITTNNGVTIDGLNIENDLTTTTLLGTSGDYIRIGDAASTSQSLASEDDLMITGNLEVDAEIFADDLITQAVTLDDNTPGYSQTYATSGTTGQRLGQLMSMTSGYTGSSETQALGFDNLVAGTGTTYTADAANYGYRPGGNRGIGGYVRASTAGHNIGALLLAGNGAYNYGLWAGSTIAKNNAKNVGVFGVGLNGGVGASTEQVGGYFTLLNQSSAPPIDQSAALIADNGSQTDDVFVARDNGTEVFVVEDGGSLVSSGTLSASGATTEYFLDISGTVNQGGSASYSAFNIDVTESATGSGDKSLITAGTGGNTLYEVNNQGNQYQIRTYGESFDTSQSVQTTDATETTCLSQDFDDNTAGHLKASIVAYDSSGGDTASFELVGTFETTASTTSQVGTTTLLHTSNESTWTATFDVSGNTARIRVTGTAATTINWMCSIKGVVTL